MRATNGYVWPASHRAGSNSQALPMGARLRLKASEGSVRRIPPQLQKIFRAMQRYGLIVADNGSDMYVSGAFDPRWNNDVLNPAFRSLTASDFDVVDWDGEAAPRPCAVPGSPSPFSFSQSGALCRARVGRAAGAQDYVIEVGSGPVRQTCSSRASARPPPSARLRRRDGTTHGFAREMRAASGRRRMRSWSRSDAVGG